jgi:predicted permease
VHLIGQPEPPPGQELVTEVNLVDAGYFETMRTPLLQGRPFTSADRGGAPRVVLVNQAFVREYLKERSPIGQRIRVDMANPDTVVEIIGVVGDVRRERLDVDPRPSVYYPFLQEPTGYMTLVIRSAGEAEALIPALRREIAAIDRALPVLSAYTMESRLAVSTADRRYPMLLLVLLGILALVLAAVGLYGVLAYLVGQRSREIGVRRALGATGASIASLILGEGLRFVGLGVLVGLAAAFATTRFLGTLLYGLSPTDPVTLGVAATILLTVGALAAWAPARRAMRVDPAVTLRDEG